ncbi:hypothetical protein SAMN06272735_2827 [Streptomyces sp. TLI_55]|uniref:hypothetical protein n=1 Tax=Streptomyces sp. TLI_55 TaxID=1938861 RepID=UPI000BCFA975|nr:hypothetical protein [Streptomyces sp. TLI_55]SNX58337.1 hypothetical protein SAMN06272735_2827 [Streptomyces sp. TLI_55]
MTKRGRAAVATGLALGAALSLLGAAGTAEAAPSGTGDVRATTVQAHSNLRDAPRTSGRLLHTTTEETEAGILCYSRGERVTAGGYTTDVWYYGQVVDYAAGQVFNGVYVWGGNVNVGTDPAAGIELC